MTTPPIVDTTFQPVALEALADPRPPRWLGGARWAWEVRGQHGGLLADGEGCRTAGEAIEFARHVASGEGWLRCATDTAAPKASIDSVWPVIRDAIDSHNGDDNPSRVARNVVHAIRAAGFEIVWAEAKSG